MGARSYIVRGLGNPESKAAAATAPARQSAPKKLFSVEDQVRATEGVECRKDANVIDEIPMASKDIDAVMAQRDSEGYT